MTGRHIRYWGIGEGEQVVIDLPNKVTAEQVAKLRRYIDVLGMESEIYYPTKCEECDGIGETYHSEDGADPRDRDATASMVPCWACQPEDQP